MKRKIIEGTKNFKKPNIKKEIDIKIPQKRISKKQKKYRYRKKEKNQPIILHNNIIHMFTDGSCLKNPGPAGSACILFYNNYRKIKSKYLGVTTINVAELTAIKMGLELIKTGYRDIPIVIYTDSMYCICLLSMNWKARKNVKLIGDIKSLISDFENVTFVKVKSHSGVRYNNAVDRLAKKASGVLKK